MYLESAVVRRSKAPFIVRNDDNKTGIYVHSIWNDSQRVGHFISIEERKAEL